MSKLLGISIVSAMMWLATALASGVTVRLEISPPPKLVADAKPTLIHVRSCAERTYVLREDLRATWEAPFLYLLVGDQRALLIDTGDIADSASMPLADTVLNLLPSTGTGKLPLLVVHTHGHLDHRAGDSQFKNRPGVEVVDAGLPSVQSFFRFTDWPDGVAQIDLGGRIVDVLPAPGHHRAEIVFYDRSTECLFSGDFILPGRILVEDLGAYESSADRLAAFVQGRPVHAVLGGHIERDRAGRLFPWASNTHPDEGELALTKAEVIALPAALRRFNGFYSEVGGFTIENPGHNLIAGGTVCLLGLALLGTFTVRWIRRRNRKRRLLGDS